MHETKGETDEIAGFLINYAMGYCICYSVYPSLSFSFVWVLQRRSVCLFFYSVLPQIVAIVCHAFLILPSLFCCSFSPSLAVEALMPHIQDTHAALALAVSDPRSGGSDIIRHQAFMSLMAKIAESASGEHSFALFFVRYFVISALITASLCCCCRHIVRCIIMGLLLSLLFCLSCHNSIVLLS